MADWEKMNQAFYSFVEKMTDEDWNNWNENQMSNQIIRQATMEIDAHLHLLKISMQNAQTYHALSIEQVSNRVTVSSIEKIEIHSNIEPATIASYSFAA